MPDLFDTSRAVLALRGEDTVHFLQGLLTQDVAACVPGQLQFSALLSPQGKILHDMFLLPLADSTILLDTPASGKETLLNRLKLYKLRANVTITDETAAYPVGYATNGGLADPRHTALPHRMYGAASLSPDAYHRQRRTVGIPDSDHDFTPDSVVALDAGYDLLHAISYTKGCYVGQEVTARMHYKHVARRGFYQLLRNGEVEKLALLKFEDAASGSVTEDGTTYQLQLPQWMAPKYAQFQSGRNN